jgi:galactokinase
VVKGDVPIGSGLSSSAALELATARTFAEVCGWAWDATAMAKLCQRAENKWVGVNCGIMDQLISATGQAGHAVLIDCRSLEGRAVPLPSGSVVVVLDTATRRGLEASAYNERRSQCETAAAHFGKQVLRDVDEAAFAAEAGKLEETTRRRARHVISENARTVRAADALQQGDAEAVGKLMDESHESLREDFEVSCDELDAMVAAARAAEGCYGARMTGAGFGGCAIALVREDAAEAFTASVSAAYAKATSLTPQLYVCQATDGAAVVG